jgi:hypothetical protein
LEDSYGAAHEASTTCIRLADTAAFLDKSVERMPASRPQVAVGIASSGDRNVKIHDRMTEYRARATKPPGSSNRRRARFRLYYELREVPVLELPESELAIQESDLFE